ncbi:hypothetical protein TIFTF001_023523 [Ficus carica]|uniref:Hexosyltransferase n=1 Tax=Ficus carica TaxID=3494 RepID=A0AA88B042_FICCA|nr:hypothetical protein TIFTF001_023523 [Ficus carica]
MPSSPKFFHARQPHSARRSTVLIVFCCFLVGIAGFAFGLASLLRPLKCPHGDPRSVRVVWERGAGGNGGGVISDGGGGDGSNRRKVMGFVGIQTGFGSIGRRRSLRKTWMPSDPQGLRRPGVCSVGDLQTLAEVKDKFLRICLEEATGLAFRFVIGKTNDKSKMAELKKEVAEYDDFLLLDIEEEYSKLPYKTLAFFKAAHALYDSEFYVKADDDIYLRPDRLSLLLAKERSHSQTYLGCMKKGPVFTDPKLKCFRMFSNEDVTIGAWMLAMNVNHENNQALCSPECTSTSIAVWDIPKCSGLCNPEARLLELHEKEICSRSPTMMPED